MQQLFLEPVFELEIQFLQHEKILFIVLFLNSYLGYTCTIFCGIDSNNHVWAANNEDGAYSFVNYINVYPSSDNTKHGYFTLSYHSTENGNNGNLQGGMNEAGLFFDMNSIPTALVKNIASKEKFPAGDDAILPYIFQNFEKVEQEVNFFEQYWFEYGLRSAQIHVADKYGTFAILGPAGYRTTRNEKYQISTNFDICGNEDYSNQEKHWRFPIVKRELEKMKVEEVGLESFKAIFDQVAIKGKGYYGGHTIYTNIQNLNTGQIWFYFTSDYNTSYKTSIQELLKKGQKSYLIRDLFPEHPVTKIYNTYLMEEGVEAYNTFKALDIDPVLKEEVLKIFTDEFMKNYDLELLPFLEKFLESDPGGHVYRSARAINYFQQGELDKAKQIVIDYKEIHPETSMPVEKLLNRFEGKFEDGTNTTVELHGHQDATQVFVKGIPTDFNFLTKKNGKWIGKFNLEPGIYNYSFLVDGREVFDSKTEIIYLSTYYNKHKYAYKTHQIKKGFSDEIYRTTIKVKVPNIDDVVYIAGNQFELTNWNPVFRLQKTGDYEREITLDLHMPAKFKFTKGNWNTEAIIQDNTKDTNGEWLPLEYSIDSDNSTYIIKGWQDNTLKTSN